MQMEVQIWIQITVITAIKSRESEARKLAKESLFTFGFEENTGCLHNTDNKLAIV
jgi:hypothetical protein